jgi:peptide/nickel transport system ATP-binding protein
MIFQDPFASLDSRMTVGSIIEEPLVINKAAAGRALKDRVAELLTLVGLRPEHANRYPHAFSGGQRQRIGIARAIALNPDLIVCDEAVSALDVSVQAQILNLLEELQRRLGLAYLFISHDLAAVEHIADRVVVMYVGRIVESGPVEQLYTAPKHPYTEALLAAVPQPDPRVRTRPKLLTGDVPSPANPPGGCYFHPRCPYAQPVCATETPPVRQVGEGHLSACHFAGALPLAGAATAAPAS